MDIDLTFLSCLRIINEKICYYQRKSAKQFSEKHKITQISDRYTVFEEASLESLSI